MMFANREEAAQLLADRLSDYASKNSIIVAIPRGGVPVGYIIAKSLGLPLDVFLVKKIGHPQNREYAIGAVSLEGLSVDRELETLDPAYLEQECKRITSELKRRYTLFTGRTAMPDFKNKSVILVDDGIATGSTMMLAAKSIRRAGAYKVIIAVPVAPPSAASLFHPLCDEYICIYEPTDFSGVGQFYESFPQVEDEEVVRLLRLSSQERT